MKRLVLSFGAAAVLAAFSATVCADWYENFDSYEAGSGLHGQGGWHGWQGDPGADAYVTDLMALSDPNSVEITLGSDIVHEYEGYTSGQWVYTAWQYIPDDFVGESYFILLNTYDDGAGAYNWSTQVRFDDEGYVESEFETAQLPLITGEWVELRVEIDLDADVQDIYYGGDLLSSKSWTDGVSGGGAVNIGAVDLFANGASPVYYDDMSLVPAPGVLVLLGGAGLLGARRRRR
jgi:hypothetical protein